MFNDRLADAVIKLETRILRTEEYIKLLATKEYVDSETGAIYTKYDAELSVMAEEISARVTEEQFATAQEAITLANNAAKAAQTAADNANQSVTSLNTYVDGAFADGIITEAEAKAIEKYLNTVNTSKDSVTATYTKLYSNTYLDGAAKTGLKSAKDVLDSSISALISSINTAIADGKTTASEKADVDKKFAAFNTAMSSFESAVETANKYIQDKLKDYTDTATNQVKVKLESDLSVQAGQITGISTRVDNIRNEIDTAGWINTTQGNTLFAAKSLENGDNIISYINQTATTTTIKAERINLVGAVTFSMFNTSLQSTISGKANSSDLGGLAYENEVAMSNLSSTLQSIIENKVDPSDLTTALMPYVTSTSLTESLKKYELTGVADDKVKDLINALTGKQSTTIINGFIDTSLLNADKIIANAAHIAGFTIESNRLYNKEMSSGIELSNASGTKFIYINSIGSSSALQVRNDYGTALSIGSYDTGGVGIEVTGNTGATAIESNGPVKLITRSDEEIRMYRNDSSYLARFSFKGHKFSDYRTVINVGNLMNSNQIKTLTGKDPDGFQIRYDSQSGYIYVQV